VLKCQAGDRGDGSCYGVQTAARRAVVRTFEDESYNLTSKEVTWNFFVESIPQKDRSVNHSALLCVSKTMDDGKLASAFADGVLWIRAGVPDHVPVLQTASYVNPLLTGMEFSAAALSKQALLRQHVSGAGMYQAVPALTSQDKSPMCVVLSERCNS
jgi:hypothetical protein